MKNLLAIISVFMILLAIFAPAGIIYAFLIHFTGQDYASIPYLLLFLILFCVIDIGVGTWIDSLLNAVKDRYKAFYTNTFLRTLLEWGGTLMVLSMLDFFMDGIDISLLMKVVITIIHGVTGLFLEKIEVDEEEGRGLPPEVEADIQRLLQEESWTDCVKRIQAKYPEIPKSEIIKAVRTIHKQK